MRKILFSSFLLIMGTIAFCEEWEFIVIHDSFYYAINNYENIYANQKIISNNRASYGINNDGLRIPLFGFFHNTQRSPFLNANNIKPVNTKDLFGEDLLASNNNFMASYCIDILLSKKRETLLEYELYYKENQSYFEAAYMRDIYWHEEYDSYAAGFFAYNAVLFFGALYAECQALIVNNIEKTEYGYNVRCRESSSPNRIMITILSTEWKSIQEKTDFNLLIYIDGDYIDLYINNMENKLGTFVSVSDEFVKQFNNLIKTNNCDLTNVHWPRRANGTMDYPPPIINNANDQSSLEENEQFSNSEITLETELPQTTKDSQFPLWLFIGGGLVLLAAVGVGVVVAVKRKKV